ncbi:MAG: hypothetical protein AAB325_11520, partial [Pseudomonadota bacterium]
MRATTRRIDFRVIHFTGSKQGAFEMQKQNSVRLGLSGLGSFARVIAGAVKKSKNAELTTC